MLKIVPIFQKEAKYFIAKHHRHHKPPLGSVFQIAVHDGDKIVGVAMVGRPIARRLQDGVTLEVNRLCTDGTKNACSMLYATCWRVAKNMGYNRLITYILDTESGTTLNAAGWKLLGIRGGLSWDVPSRQRETTYPKQMKLLYEVK